MKIRQTLILFFKGKIDQNFFLFFAVFSIAAFFVLFWFEFVTGGRPVLYGICLLIGMVNSLIIFLSIGIMRKKAAVDWELALAQEIIASGTDYYKRLDRILQEIHIQRHDYKYQIGMIEELAKITKAKHIREFLETTHRHYTRTEPQVYCENLVISALLANYMERFAAAGIPFTVQAAVPVEIPRFDETAPPLDNYEICIVLGNVLENSFEGVMTAKAADRRVSLVVCLRERRLLIETKNTFDGKIVFNKSRPRQLTIPLSRKGTAGGYGLRSIAAVCGRHCGEYLPEWTKTEYTVRILLNV